MSTSYFSAIVIGVGLLLTGPAMAATITVNTTLENSDNPSHCTLKQAITAANTDAAQGGCLAGSGIDVIELQSGATYVLASIDNTAFDQSQNSLGDDFLPQIGDAPTILHGNGATISRSKTAPEGRAFFNRTAFFIQDLTISGFGFTGSGFLGGAIYGDGGVLKLSNVTLSGNSAGGGGGVYFGNGGSNFIADSVFDGNSAQFGGGFALFLDTSLTITDSIFSNNSGNGGGGGVNVAGHLTVTQSTFKDNTAPILTGQNNNGPTGLGGALGFSGGTARLSQVSIFGNSAELLGGGLVFIAQTEAGAGSYEFNDCHIFENSSELAGGGVAHLFKLEDTPPTVHNSITFQNSFVVANDAPLGGGLLGLDPVAPLTFGGGVVVQNTDDDAASDIASSGNNKLGNWNLVNSPALASDTVGFSDHVSCDKSNTAPGMQRCSIDTTSTTPQGGGDGGSTGGSGASGTGNGTGSGSSGANGGSGSSSGPNDSAIGGGCSLVR